MAKRKGSSKHGGVKVVLREDRNGLGKAGETVSIGDARAKRWCAEGICELSGEVVPAEAVVDDSPQIDEKKKRILSDGRLANH